MCYSFSCDGKRERPRDMRCGGKSLSMATMGVMWQEYWACNGAPGQEVGCELRKFGIVVGGSLKGTFLQAFFVFSTI
jgi:hypothetical protein